MQAAGAAMVDEAIDAVVTALAEEVCRTPLVVWRLAEKGRKNFRC